MNPFIFQRATDASEAVASLSATPRAKLLGGGTNLVDLMKMGVETPAKLIDINRLPLAQIEPTPGGGVRIGALVRNSDLAEHPLITARYPVLSQALLAGASPQLRNLATVGGNLLQRTRCYYFYDPAFPACNKRDPGSGCGALKGYNRMHAILGQSDACIAVNPSDMNVALAALEATVHVRGPKGERVIPLADFHRLPGQTPQLETALGADEMIIAVELRKQAEGTRSLYVKVRDRASYAFALVSAAAVVDLGADGVIRGAQIALGGVAHKPWRAKEAEAMLIGAKPDVALFAKAAQAALAGARGYEYNAFKIALAQKTIVRALTAVTTES